MEESLTTVALHRMPLYNTSRLTDAEVIAVFAVRLPLLNRLIGDLKAETSDSRAQHHLVVGQRGMGKTTLLARLAAELRTGELSQRFIPLVFAEEQYDVNRLSKFWLNCLDSLADEHDRAGNKDAVESIDSTVSRLTRSNRTMQEATLANEALEAFLEAVAITGRRPVLLLDNLKLLFDRFSNEEAHQLREVLMRPASPIIIGASPSPLSESQDYGAAFYDHFKVHYLSPLSEEEMKTILLHLANITERPEVRDRVLKHPERLKVLRQLTGGNPRTTVTLFFLYAEDFSPNVFGDLENLLDRVTPLYKARFEELSDQQQVIASAIANHWDPITARMLSDNTGIGPQQISPQLDRLEKTGFIEKVELFGNASAAYQLAERFFNVWFLMRSASRRQRREVEFLTRFLQSFYAPPERTLLAQKMMTERSFTSDRYIFTHAVADSLEDSPIREDLRRHAQVMVLRDKNRNARRQMEDMFDFSAVPSATLEFDQLRRKVAALVPEDASVTGDEFADTVLGSRHMFSNGDRERLATRTVKLPLEELTKILEFVEYCRNIDRANYSDSAITWFSERLRDGQLRAFNDIEDWNRAFKSGRSIESIRLMLDTMPTDTGDLVDSGALECICRYVLPNQESPATQWFNWAYYLHMCLARYEEAEKAYQESINRDIQNAVPWNNLGNLLSEYLGRHEEAEGAYREAIARDPQDIGPWNNLGILLGDYLGRYEEAEGAYREAIARDPHNARPWNGLGILLGDYLGRYEEAKGAYQEAIARDPHNAVPWNNLGDLLSDHLGLYEEAEVAYRNAVVLIPQNSMFWNDLGNLLSDYLGRYEEAEQAFSTALKIDPTNDTVRQNLIFLRRDFIGQALEVRPLLNEVALLPKIECEDTMRLQEALFCAYESNWGLAQHSLAQALDLVPQGFPPATVDDWMRASAVLLHLNYGAELLAFLEERDDQVRLRPWYEALRALHLGDRRYLQNIAPEIRSTAENFYDQIEIRLNRLPDSTRRRPLPTPTKKGKSAKK